MGRECRRGKERVERSRRGRDDIPIEGIVHNGKGSLKDILGGSREV